LIASQDASDCNTNYVITPTPTVSSTHSLVTNCLALSLNTNNPASYPGSGSVWCDSINGYCFTGTFPTYSSSQPIFMNFAGDDITTSLSNSNAVINLSAGTIETWIKWDSITNDRVAFSYGGNNNDQGFILLSQNNTNNKIGISTWRENGHIATYLGNTCSSSLLGSWIHLAATYDSTCNKVYVNGQLAVSESAAGCGNLKSSTTGIRIGDEYNRDYNFDGCIATINYYSCVLTQSEIENNYDLTKCRFTGSWYPDITPTASATRYNTVTSSATPTRTQTRTPTYTKTTTQTKSTTTTPLTPTPTASSTRTRSYTPTPTNTSTNTPTSTLTKTPTATATVTPTYTYTRTKTSTPTSTSNSNYVDPYYEYQEISFRMDGNDGDGFVKDYGPNNFGNIGITGSCFNTCEKHYAKGSVKLLGHDSSVYIDYGCHPWPLGSSPKSWTNEMWVKANCNGHMAMMMQTNGYIGVDYNNGNPYFFLDDYGGSNLFLRPSISNCLPNYDMTQWNHYMFAACISSSSDWC